LKYQYAFEREFLFRLFVITCSLYTCPSCLQNYWREFEGIWLWRVCIICTRVPSNNFGGNSTMQQVRNYMSSGEESTYRIHSVIDIWTHDSVMDVKKYNEKKGFFYIPILISHISLITVVQLEFRSGHKFQKT